MTREEKLESFLNAFWEGSGNIRAADLDFRDAGREKAVGSYARMVHGQEAGVWNGAWMEKGPVADGCMGCAQEGEAWDAPWTAGEWETAGSRDYGWTPEGLGEGVLPEDRRVMAVPRGKGKLPLRTKASIFLILVLIPLTIWAGIHLFNDRKYLVIGLAIAVYSIIPFFLVFEGRKPQARELLVIAVLAAIAVAGRAAFFMVGNFKPVAAVVIVSAVCFGAEAGFMVGAVSMLASNMLVGQGPWTPWQMFSMGIIGFLAGIFFQKGWLEARRGALCAFGFLTVLFVYGGIMNPASLVMMSSEITWKGLLAVYISGIPMDLVHAASTVIFLWIASRPMIEKLERIKVKYGLLEG